MTDLLEPFITKHADGALWARGTALDGAQHGNWERFCKDATKLRSGHFEQGEQIGEWTTYDGAGAPFKVTTIKTKVKN